MSNKDKANVEDLGGFTPSKAYTFVPIETGTYDAVVHGIVKLSQQAVSVFVNGKPTDQKVNKAQIKVIFEIPSLMRDDDQSSTMQTVINLSDSPDKGSFAKFLRLFNITASKKTDILTYMLDDNLKTILGKTLSLSIVKETGKDNKERSKVLAFDKGGMTRLDPRLPQPVPTRELFYFNPRNPDMEVFKNTLSYWTKRDVMNAVDSDQFPKELQQEWVKVQEEWVKKQEEYAAKKAANNNSDTSTGDTKDIE